eukprot:CAMPEP_0197557560 /NCGR_PEP_ID=MMETSP1320-20131121/17340_1 /TAXON_ID=91990 /ORGANISM="Bolidomonas sp., Strain RCC2347" /LENGTH=111 /DNA_ID=CAMNT_0043118809 /DNA_START=52 /DNA_END=387 /DNA_ORIENTATION=-
MYQLTQLERVVVKALRPHQPRLYLRRVERHVAHALFESDEVLDELGGLLLPGFLLLAAGFGEDLAILEHEQLRLLHLDPLLVRGERLRRDDAALVARGGEVGKVHVVVDVD